MTEMWSDEIEQMIDDAKTQCLKNEGDTLSRCFDWGVEAMAAQLSLLLARRIAVQRNRVHSWLERGEMKAYDSRGEDRLAAEPSGGDDQPDADGEG